MVTADLPKLESVAQQLAARLRDDDPRLTWAWLARELPEPADWYRLAHVLACAVPVDKTWGELTAWARESDCQIGVSLSPSPGSGPVSTGYPHRRPQVIHRATCEDPDSG